jgi:hypothetical protein
MNPIRLNFAKGALQALKTVGLLIDQPELACLVLTQHIHMLAFHTAALTSVWQVKDLRDKFL